MRLSSTAGALASSGIRYPGAASFPTGIWGGRLHQSITTGVDGNGPGSAEAIMIWDLGRDYYLGADPGGIGANQFDFRSLALHELTHALGFASPIRADGSGFRENTPGAADVFSRFDTFLRTGAGVPLINGSAFDLNTLSSLTANDIFFMGSHAVAANGGMPVPIYAPGLWDAGSSISHLDDPNDPLYYGLSRGAVRRSWTDVDVGVLRDLGYVVVPEPQAWALLTLAAAFLGVRLLRVRSSGLPARS